jgi:hypothetical protein
MTAIVKQTGKILAKECDESKRHDYEILWLWKFCSLSGLRCVAIQPCWYPPPCRGHHSLNVVQYISPKRGQCHTTSPYKILISLISESGLRPKISCSRHRAAMAFWISLGICFQWYDQWISEHTFLFFRSLCRVSIRISDNHHYSGF